MAKTFLYFAYGSNLLQQRIHINNPSAKRTGIGKLEGYSLTFDGHSKGWKGSPATIVPSKDSYVWGALWTLDIQHLSTLDKQEYSYFPLDVDVITSEGVKKCRTYQLDKEVAYYSFDKLPDTRKPSKVYLDVILQGAKESKLPQEYLKILEKIPHNGYSGSVEIKVNL